MPYKDTESKEQTLGSVGNLIIYGGYYVAVLEGVYIEAGKTLKLSWSADGNLHAYILTETQFQDFKDDGIASNYEAYMYAREGTISAYIRHSDKYYAVLSRLPFASSVKVYQAQATLIWQETVTKYHTEYVPKNVADSLYLYIGAIAIIIGCIFIVVPRKL
ncbi:MAG: hypothetical protein QW660_03630 [Candidatus Bathyarchaeia archaeon]